MANQASNPRAPEQLGRYSLIELLGVGGMAEVFKARCTGPGGFQRTVVVKRILPANTRRPEFVRMFVSEAKILGMLHHPNVVQVYDFGESDGNLFLVLEYVDGPSLAEAILALREAGRSIPPMVAARIAHQICLALDHVHNLLDADGVPLNVIHRDVTPSNIVLNSAGAIKLLDFGVAKYRASQSRSQQGTLKGKPAYLAPETLERGAIDRRIDLFAVGVVLHELLTLEHLFEGDNTAITFNRVLRMPVPLPSRVRRDVPPALDAIVMKSLERDPTERYQTAHEMAVALDRLLVAEAAGTDDAIAFAGELAALVRPTPVPAERKTGTTIAANTRRYFTRRLRASRVGKILFGPAKA
ncbi:MAG TPA: serine/threonine-protein kinase [Polyangia bacterium]